MHGGGVRLCDFTGESKLSRWHPCYLHGRVDSLRCSFLNRMSCEVDLGEHRRFGGADCSSECLFVATLHVVDWNEADPVSTGARHPRGIFKARVEGPCIRSLT